MNKNDWYFIGEFIHRDNKKIFDILKCFASNNRKIVFRHYYFKLDDQDDEFKLEIIGYDFDLFCRKGIRYNKPENRLKIELEVKNILYENFKNSFNLNSAEIEKIKQELFDKLCNYEFLDIDNEVLNSVKELISKSISEEDIPEEKEFITKREVFRNSIKISYGNDNIENIEEPVECVWYCPNNDLELLKAIEIEEFLQCIVVENITDMNEYLYAFDFFEQNNYVLAVNDRCGNFSAEIASKVKMALKESCYVLDEESYLKSRNY